jgi:hypothetical protein
MRWFSTGLAAALLACAVPGEAYQAARAASATFTQPFSPNASEPKKPEDAEKEDPKRRELLAKIDADIARYARKGDKKKVAELKAMRAAVLGAKTDEQLAVWARKFEPPQGSVQKKAPVVADAKAVREPALAAPALSAGKNAVATASSGVEENGTDESGLTSLFDGGESRSTEVSSESGQTLRDAPASVPFTPSPAATPAPVSAAPAPNVGPGREIVPVADYPRPKNVPLKWQAPPMPDRDRDMSVPASLPELERIAASQGIPLDIFRMTYAEARRQNVDYRLVLAVMRQESRFKSKATSHAGARGLMQVMPATGRDLGVRNASQLYDKQTSIWAGTKYIRMMRDMFNASVDFGAAVVNSFDSRETARIKKAVAAYNAGPGNVRKYGGIPPFKETQGYVVKVLDNYYNYMRSFPPAAAGDAKS